MEHGKKPIGIKIVDRPQDSNIFNIQNTGDDIKELYSTSFNYKKKMMESSQNNIDNKLRVINY